LAAAWDGGAYRLFYTEHRVGGTEQLQTVRVTAYGGLLVSVPATSRPSSFQSAGGAVPTPNGVLFSWTDGNDVRWKTFSPISNDLGDGTLLSRTFADQTGAAASSDGRSLVVAWIESGVDVVATVFDVRTPAEGRPTIDLHAGSATTTTSVRGIHYVFWSETAGDRALVRMMRIDDRAQVLDHVPIEIASEPLSYTVYAPILAAAANEREIAIAWTSGPNLSMTRLSLDGRLLDFRPVTIDSNGDQFKFAPRILWNGTDFVAFWIARPPYFIPDAPAPLYDIRSATIRGGNATANEAIATWTRYPFHVGVVATPSGFAALWREYFFTFSNPIYPGPMNPPDPYEELHVARLSREGISAGTRSVLPRDLKSASPTNGVELLGTRCGALALLSETGGRLVVRVLDRDLVLRDEELVVAEANEGEARIIAAAGHAFVISGHVDDRYAAASRLFISQIDGTFCPERRHETALQKQVPSP
jgi:hypothetical protein